MKQRVFTILLAVFCCVGFQAAGAAEGDLIWSHLYGGSGDESAYAIVPAGDGGFVFAGSTTTYGAGSYDMWMVKIDALGNLVWYCPFGSSASDLCWCLLPAGDGGFLMAGLNTNPVTMDQNMCLVKVNSQGHLLWFKSIGDPQRNEAAYALLPSGDGGYLMAGSYDPANTGNFDLCLVKVDAQGDSLWTKIYGGTNADWALGLTPTGDGNFMVTGCTGTWGAGGFDMWLLKVDADGDTLWTRTYGTPWDDWASAVIPSGDGGYLLAGTVNTQSSWIYEDLSVVKVNAQGDPLWFQTWGGDNREQAFGITPSGDGCFLVAGYTRSFAIALAADFYVLKVDANGDTLWARTYGGPNWDRACAIIPYGDGNFLISGDGDGTEFWSVADAYMIKIQGPVIPPVNITLTPLNPPIVIPASGGSFSYTAAIANDSSAALALDAWVMLRLPNQSWYGPVLGPLSFTLPGNSSLTRLRTQTVPGTALAGQYWYEARLGDYPSLIWDTSGFGFTKLGTGAGGLESGGWSCLGEPFPGEPSPTALIPSNLDLSATPNPFNPTTTIRYQLASSAPVHLNIHDVQGRLVATLVEGTQAAGRHEVKFDGSALPSGVYLYRLAAGANSASGKLMLLK